jgi:hypothetical protein
MLSVVCQTIPGKLDLPNFLIGSYIYIVEY